MQRKLPYSRQQIEDDDIAAVVECLRGEMLTTGPRVDAFEQALRDIVRAKHVVACSNGTAALHLASLAAGITDKSQVIVPTLTFLATANAPRLVGADVVFADVDADSGLLTPDTFAEALSRAPHAKAVFPVHLNGAAVNMPVLREMAEKYGLTVIEDACHALGTTYDVNGRAGAVGDCGFSDMAAFSFHPVKAIAMGEGGAVATNNSDMADRLFKLRNHGMIRTPELFHNSDMAHDAAGRLNSWYYEMHAPGFNYRVPDILCSLGISQLKKLDRFVSRRRALASCYDRELAKFAPWISPAARPSGAESSFHLYVALIDFAGLGVSRAQVMEMLRKENIFTQVHYTPVHMQPYYRSLNPSLVLPGAEAYYARALSLPLFPDMADDDVDRVVDALTRATGLSGNFEQPTEGVNADQPDQI